MQVLRSLQGFRLPPGALARVWIIVQASRPGRFAVTGHAVRYTQAGTQYREVIPTGYTGSVSRAARFIPIDWAQARCLESMKPAILPGQRRPQLRRLVLVAGSRSGRACVPARHWVRRGHTGTMADTDLGFRGEVADLYHRYRHGYPEPVIAAIGRIFALSDGDLTVDLGCGTGQLALPMAARVRAVLGVDPEPDMLLRARRAAGEAGVVNVSWMIGADTDMPAIRALLGSGAVGAVTVGQALHWMNRAALFAAAGPLLRPGGGIAVVTNGTPLWLQDTDWSRAIREVLEGWTGHKARATCGTDEQSQRRYGDDLSAAGYEVITAAVDYDVELTADQLTGGIYSALGADRLPPSGQRAAFAARIAGAIAPRDHVIEHVHVAVLAGRIR